MKTDFFIPVRFPSLNEYIGAMNRNRYLGNKMKQENTDLVSIAATGVKKFDKPVNISFIYYEPNNRRDVDNVVFAKKFILDGLVRAGVLQDDSQKWVRDITDSVKVTKIPHKVGVYVRLEEVNA